MQGLLWGTCLSSWCLTALVLGPACPCPAKHEGVRGCTYPAWARSAVGASSPGRAVGQRVLSVVSLCLSLSCPSTPLPVPWCACCPMGFPCQWWGIAPAHPNPRAAPAWQWLEGMDAAGAVPLVPVLPTRVLLCKSSPAGGRISGIVCAPWSVAEKMKLCLQTPVGTNSMLK